MSSEFNDTVFAFKEPEFIPEATELFELIERSKIEYPEAFAVLMSYTGAMGINLELLIKKLSRKREAETLDTIFQLLSTATAALDFNRKDQTKEEIARNFAVAIKALND